jgi:TetR/AcrR family transcriptional regulator of autoinduction and epiphytic fitness
MTADTTAEDTPIDGRTARRDRNRDLVLDAVLELFADNQFAPNAADVAARSGVSLRSVYRYYEDFDELVRAAIARHAERVAPLIEMPDPGKGPLDERVVRFVAHRTRLYEASAPMARATLVRAPANRLVREQVELVRKRLSKQTHAMFAPELSALPTAQRRAIGAAADTLTQFESAENLRVRLGYSSAQTSDILRRSLLALLTNRDR